MKINIVFVSDNNYAEYMLVSILSILQNKAPADILNFYVCDNNISAQNKQNISAYVARYGAEITFIDTKTIFKKLDVISQKVAYISKTSYLKFLIAQCLPQLDKVLYLDCDLVVKSSLADLYAVDLKDYLLGGVEDIGYVYWFQHSDNMPHYDFPINSGVMLINCAAWRKERVAEKLIAYAKDPNRKDFGQDQPVINYVCAKRILPLDYKWNMQDSFYRDYPELHHSHGKNAILAARKAPGVIHYTTKQKPWNSTSVKEGESWIFYAAQLRSASFQKICSKYKWKKILRSIFSITVGYEYPYIYKIFTVFGIQLKKRNRKAEEKIYGASAQGEK